ncbi:T9SS C-terminal target domain-containing protein [Crocinitomix catalasitica]|uniref:T9SS C-terminal target domain-containing protein n=1 Tax=Crocinitomix catalasitica TaxID=184607 RepID=UPI0004850589|nr:T9SS C-terminal target domain-containing protein [Crocinitomix catalasitica]
MKWTKLTFVVLAYCFSFSNSYAQIEGANGFLMSPGVEIGINSNGFEGSTTLPSFANHVRGGFRMGFLANPQDDGWTNYDGDFFMPGSPENRFGIEVDGVTYTNSAAMGSFISSDGLSNYQTIGKCKFMDWDGSVAGIDIHMTYKLDTTDHYYTVQVALTNTTAADKNDVYFFKSLDPDNNQDISWGFATLNTIEYQPRPSCPKALVSATDTHDWESYLGLGGLGSEFRVAHGGFYVDSGSDLWNGRDVYDTTLYSNNGLSDDAIGICHKDDVIPAGATTTFEIVVVLNGSQVNEALMNLIHFTYEGGPEIAESCTDTVVFDEYDGVIYEDDDVADTIYRCTYEPSMLWVEAPGEVISEYNLAWLEEGELLSEEAYFTVLPGTEAGVRNISVYLTLGECFGGGTGIKNDYVIITQQSPELEYLEGIHCTDPVLLSDLVVNDTAEVWGTTWTYHNTSPLTFDDVDPYGSMEISEGDSVYLLVVDPRSNCFDTTLLTIETIVTDAGLDNSITLCDVGSPTTNLNDLLVDADPDGRWEEITYSGSFNRVSGEFIPAGVLGGEYVFYYKVGGDPCPADTAVITVTMNELPDAGIDGSIETCNDPLSIVDLNELLSGHDAGGFWTELTASDQFNPGTGEFNANELSAGDYRFSYTVDGIAPCASDASIFVVTIPNLPVAEFVMSPTSEVYTDDPMVTFYNSSLNSVRYEWNFGDGADISTEENPIHEFPSEPGRFDVTLMAYNELGCKDSLRKIMEVKDIVLFYIPNSFTPDGNNFNDIFKPVFYSGFDPYDYHMMIFNRYGEVVFESYDSNVGWNGTYAEQGIASDGVYTWAIDFKEQNSDRRQKHTGFVTIIK